MPTERRASSGTWNCGGWARRIMPSYCRNRSAFWVATDKRQPDGTETHLILVTNRLDLTAELMTVAYRYRWSVELFFRWLKCVLGCRHLLCQSENGVTFQVYSAIIAGLLLSLWIGRSPNKATYEMVCHYLSGWATEEELFGYLERSRLTVATGKK